MIMILFSMAVQTRIHMEVARTMEAIMASIEEVNMGFMIKQIKSAHNKAWSNLKPMKMMTIVNMRIVWT
jgi:hypothetical protein